MSPDAGRGQTDAHCHLRGSPLCPSRRAPRCCLGSFPIQLPAAPLSPHISTQVPMIYKSGLFLLNLSALNRHGVAGTAVPLKHEACCHPPYKPPDASRGSCHHDTTAVLWAGPLQAPSSGAMLLLLQGCSLHREHLPAKDNPTFPQDQLPAVPSPLPTGSLRCRMGLCWEPTAEPRHLLGPALCRSRAVHARGAFPSHKHISSSSRPLREQSCEFSSLS